MTMTWIAGSTLPNSSSYGYTFSSVPQTFTHLQLRISAKNVATSGTNDQIWIQFNSDTGNNYAHHRLTGDGSSAASSGTASTGAAYLGFTPTNTSGYANMFGGIVIDILDYTNTNKNKTIRCLNGYDLNGAGLVGLHSAVWLSTAAINTILISSNVNQYITGSRFDLYGIGVSEQTGA